MSKPKVINLNDYEKVKSKDDLDGYIGLVIIPAKLENGIQLPSIFFRKGTLKHNEIKDVGSVEWFKDIRISKEGDDTEYASRVDWWYDHAISNDDYRKIINDSFNKHGFDVKKNFDMAINYLKKFNFSARKTYIHKYIWNWLTNSMHQYLKFKK